MEKGVFLEKEVGDFVNSKIICIKYNLDKADPDNIKKTYGVKAYPTFIFTNNKGEELSRMTGAPNTIDKFISSVKYSIDPANSWSARDKRFNEDSSYAIEYLTYLNNNWYKEKAETLLAELFARRSIKENFEMENLEYYYKYVTDLKSPVVKCMIEDKKKVIRVIGKREYYEFITSKTNNYIREKVRLRRKDNYAPAMEYIQSYKELHTAYYVFIKEGLDFYVNRDFSNLLALANEHIEKAQTIDRLSIVTMIFDMGAAKRVTIPNSKKLRRVADADKKVELTEFLAKAAKLEKSEKIKNRYLNWKKEINISE